MSRRRSSNRNNLDKYRATVSEEDGTDPVEFHQNYQPPEGGRKAMQLCKQVQRALSFAFSDCQDDVVRELYIESVTPAPNDKRLMVMVSPMSDNLEVAQILTHLQAATPFLRGEVAHSINRKKTPELVFQCIPKTTS